MTLQDYLLKIKNGQPVNYPQFKKKLPNNELHDHELIFKAHKLAKSKNYKVEVIDNERFEQLLANALPKPLTRTQAAQSGDSHQVATSTGFLLIYHELIRHDRPEVIVINKDQLLLPHTPKSNLLIIENQENFFAFNLLLDLLSSFAGQGLDLSNTDIVYGAGNQINKGLNFCLFEQYHSVFCAFDWDLGGLRMYKTLKSKLPEHKVHYLLPKDLTPWLGLFKLPVQCDERLIEAASLADSLGFEALARAFMTTKHFLEQEAWLGLCEN